MKGFFTTLPKNTPLDKVDSPSANALGVFACKNFTTPAKDFKCVNLVKTLCNCFHKVCTTKVQGLHNDKIHFCQYDVLKSDDDHQKHKGGECSVCFKYDYWRTCCQCGVRVDEEVNQGALKLQFRYEEGLYVLFRQFYHRGVPCCDGRMGNAMNATDAYKCQKKPHLRFDVVFLKKMPVLQ